MTERERIILGVGVVIGYCLCFVVEIWKITRFREPPQLPEPPPRPEKRDPADWWKECQ